MTNLTTLSKEEREQLKLLYHNGVMARALHTIDVMDRRQVLLVEALQNLAYYTARISPPPYGHNCQWCGDCIKRPGGAGEDGLLL